MIFNWIKLYTTSDTSEYRLTHEVGDHISRDRIITLTDAVLAIVMTLSIGNCCTAAISFRSRKMSFQNDYLNCGQLFGAMQQVS